jgi:hypothetical protein
MLRFLAGAAVFAISVAAVLAFTKLGWNADPHFLALFAIPGGYALSGLLEVITGVSFMEFARRWDELAGWQRGVFGTAIVLGALASIICAMGLFFSYF